LGANSGKHSAKGATERTDVLVTYTTGMEKR